MRTVTRGALGGLISQREFIDLLVIDVTSDHLSTNGEFDFSLAACH